MLIHSIRNRGSFITSDVDVRNNCIFELRESNLKQYATKNSNFSIDEKAGRSTAAISAEGYLTYESSFDESDVVLVLSEYVHYPRIRILDNGNFVIVGSPDPESSESSLYVYSRFGELISKKNISRGINDVCVTDKFIILTFDDVAIDSGNKYAKEGLAFFDLEGSFRFGYRSEFYSNSVEIDDCYCATSINNNLIFMAFPGFELVSIDTTNFKQSIFELPESLHGSSAISKDDNSYYFYSPYDADFTFFSYIPGEDEPARNGKFISKHIRGADRGTFISIDENSYSLISMPKHMS